jgi:AraC-like DNA-binding protein
MYLTRYRPVRPLDEFVEFLWCLSDGPTHSRERILPGGCTELVINLGADHVDVLGPDDSVQRCSGAVVAGPYTHSFDIDASKHAAMLGVHFKPVGAQALLRVPPVVLRDRHVDLDQLWGAGVDGLRARVCEATTPAERFRLVESALLARLRPDLAPRPVIAHSVDALQADACQPPIGHLADRAGISHRQFIKDFTTTVGLTPKLFSRIQRFHRAVSRIESVSQPRWAQFAVECGYADQGHMIREFQSFSGLTPVQHLSRKHVPTKNDHVALAA